MRLLDTARRVKRILGKPPGYIFRRVLQEGEAELDRWLAPMRERRMNRRRLLAMSRASSVEELWSRLRTRSFPAMTSSIDPATLDSIEPGESGRIIEAANLASERTVDLLGTGPIALGNSIDWSRDYRVDMGWPSGFARSIDYVNRKRPSDVKIPWEISRLQWLIPAGQAYLLTGNERYALAVREILCDWMAKNPVAYTVNWSCTMEAALRLFSWTWLFHVFAGSSAWSDEAFRVRFLSCLYLHGDFTRRHIEKADINGNHYTADLAGLVIAGYFFGDIGDAGVWRDIGWSGLQQEIVTQVFADGVDYEASVPYHRLVLELFLWPAMLRQANGEDIPAAYAGRLRAMAGFTVAYSREDGSSPLWGDADDARVLPFGGQKLGDHRYLVGMVAMALGDADLAARFQGSRSELIWIFGLDRVAALPSGPDVPAASAAFAEGGAYIMRHGNTHVFIDCGPVGLAGRGGHGHNDALSFEAWIDGVPVVIDRGSFVYTASFEKRNEYRSTQSHNTVCVDGQEMNRIDPGNLWNLQDDARAECTAWRTGVDEDFFSGRHSGYERLGVSVTRQIRLVKDSNILEITDAIEGQGDHEVAVALHLAPGISIEQYGAEVGLRSNGQLFQCAASGGWTLKTGPTMISPSYGVVRPSNRLVWERSGPLPARLKLVIHAVAPQNDNRDGAG
jgi:uncharacterized heparinase superfamily protein